VGPSRWANSRLGGAFAAYRFQTVEADLQVRLPGHIAELEISPGIADNADTVPARVSVRLVTITLGIFCLTALPARAQRASEAGYLTAVNTMLTGLAPASTRSALAIRENYRPFLHLLALDDFTQIETGLANGGLVPLPIDPERFNVRVRLEGTSPIGEKDMANQASYVSARPATIGCLLDIASRVKSGPIEVTSLVRHLGYQHELRMTNANATPDVPTHALGMAFDIAIVNTPLKTVQEISDVLQQMSAAGDILVIAERHQLVFHVVPQPSRLGWFTAVYTHLINGQPMTRPVANASLTPAVDAVISSLQPVPAFAAEWWAADNVPLDVPLTVRVEPDHLIGSDVSARGLAGYFGLVGELLTSTWRLMSPWSVG
jgi:hypothetical protein